MLNLTGRKEIKFLVSIQFTKGGNHNKKKSIFRILLSHLPAQGRYEYVPESSNSQTLVTASAGKVLKMRVTKQLCHTWSTN